MHWTWERWEAARSSLSYCCSRMDELEREAIADPAELDELIEHGMATATALLSLGDAPPMATAAARALWQAGHAEVIRNRERIALARARREASVQAD